jgi:hypothetical protein
MKLTMTKKIRGVAGSFDCHGDATVQRNAHCPMEHIRGYTGSHWMPPSTIWRVHVPHRTGCRYG